MWRSCLGDILLRNPDLPFKVLNGVELAAYNRETLYAPESAVGYEKEASRLYVEGFVVVLGGILR